MKKHLLLNELNRGFFLLIALILLSANSVVLAQTTTFTYQGRLTDGGTPATGNYDLQFALFDSASSGGQIGSTQSVPSVLVNGGVFTVSLDFGAGAFSGANRFLEISARLSGGGSFTLLSPRQQITATPYAVRSLLTNAADALTGACVGCVQDANINGVAGSKVNGAIPVASVPAGSTSYVQNASSLQSGTNFNISGNGTANILNAVTQYNLNGSRVLSIAGTSNVFVGGSAGLFNSGDNNSFFGRNAGVINQAGSNNSFFGSNTGFKNQTGQDNAFFGTSAGQNNTASNNAFFGSSAGKANSSGSDNAFFGFVAGELNSTGLRNSFFGGGAGRNNLDANNNSFFGNAAGYSNTTGQGNTLVGYAAGFNLTTGSNNTFVGSGTNTTSANLTNATAIGANAQVNANNTMVLGTNAVTVQVPGNLSIGGNLNGNLPPGDSSYIQNRNNQQSGNANFNINGNGTVGGTLTAADVVTDTVAASLSINAGTQYNINGNTVLNKSNNTTIVLGRNSDTVSIPNNLEVANNLIIYHLNAGGPADFNGQINLLGSVLIQAPIGGGSTQLCQTATRFIALCSSSLRYKTSIQPFFGGLDVVRRLRPIGFTWKEGGMRDLGFGAEDVEQIDPLLVTYNQQGQVEGVKYDRINVVLVNAIKEQQQQINAQQKQIRELQVALKRRRHSTNSSINSKLKSRV